MRVQQILPKILLIFLINCCFFLRSFSHHPFLFRPTTSTLLIFYQFFFLSTLASYGSAGSSGASNSMANSIGIGSAAGECRDYTGRTIQHAMHFVPPGVDMCKLCICENGHAKVRKHFESNSFAMTTLTSSCYRNCVGMPSCSLHTTTRL